MDRLGVPWSLILAVHLIVPSALAQSPSNSTPSPSSGWSPARSNPQPAGDVAQPDVRLAQFDPYASPAYPAAPIAPPPYTGAPTAPVAPSPFQQFLPPPLYNPTPLVGAQPAIWRFEPYGEFLYLRPRNASVAFGIPTRGPIAPGTYPVQIGPTGIVDPDYQPGFRVGLDVKLTEKSRLGGSYTYFRSATTDQINTAAPDFIRPLVVLPATINAATNIWQASATYDIDYDLVDFDFKSVLFTGQQTLVESLIGVCYARLDEDFTSTFDQIGTSTVQTGISFEGAGLRVGVEAERRALASGWFVYGRSEASFVGGEFKGSYDQTDPTGVPIGNNTYQSGRIVSILELELGAGWISRTGRWRFSGGYQMNGWFNTVITEDYIQAVQSNDFVDLSDTLTFDGLVARAEMRF